MRSSASEHIRPIDQAVLDLLRRHQGMTVQDFTDTLEVTATAVRQRLDRLVEVDMVERRKESAGRGRPQFRYFLTPMGQRYSAATYADLALALWAEVMELASPTTRHQILRRVAQRMSHALSDRVTEQASVAERLEIVADELTKRRVPASTTPNGTHPVLNVLACPFPDLAVNSHDRHVCEMEQEMIADAIGQSVELKCCRLDGHEHCQFHIKEAVGEK